MILERLIVILDAGTTRIMEVHVQQLAWEILALKKEATASRPRAALSLALKVMVAKAVLLTTGEWQQELLRCGLGDMISKEAVDH